MSGKSQRGKLAASSSYLDFFSLRGTASVELSFAGDLLRFWLIFFYALKKMLVAAFGKSPKASQKIFMNFVMQQEGKRRRLDESAASEGGLLDLPVETLHIIFDFVLDGEEVIEGLMPRLVNLEKEISEVEGNEVPKSEYQEIEDEGEKEEVEQAEEKEEKEEREEHEDGSEDEGEEEKIKEENEDDSEDEDQQAKWERRSKRRETIPKIYLIKSLRTKLKEWEDRLVNMKMAPGDPYYVDIVVGVESACEHLVRCFFFSCKHLHSVLIDYPTLWQKLYEMLVWKKGAKEREKALKAKRSKQKIGVNSENICLLPPDAQHLRELLKERDAVWWIAILLD